MTLRLIVLLLASLGMAPAVLWALLSLLCNLSSVVFRPISISFRLYSGKGVTWGLNFSELPTGTSLCILAGAGLILAGIGSIPRPN